MLFTRILGLAGDPAFHDRIHALDHEGRVEIIAVPEAEAARRRLRAVTDRGRDCAIALDRSERLADGAVLHLADDLAILVRLDGGARLRLVPADLASAMRLGHWCGNLHWRVEFGEGHMDVILERSAQEYRDRLRDLEGLADFTIVAP
ncbi:MAG: urease accessory protein UreE [Pseudomonadota bacterium]